MLNIFRLLQKVRQMAKAVLQLFERIMLTAPIYQCSDEAAKLIRAYHKKKGLVPEAWRMAPDEITTKTRLEKLKIYESYSLTFAQYDEVSPKRFNNTKDYLRRKHNYIDSQWFVVKHKTLLIVEIARAW